jgi:hypothetical protein
MGDNETLHCLARSRELDSGVAHVARDRATNPVRRTHALQFDHHQAADGRAELAAAVACGGMTSESGPDLVEALERFLRDAAHMVEPDHVRNELHQPSPEALAESLAALPACRGAATAARRAAQANGYVVSSFPHRRRASTPTPATDNAANQDQEAAPFGPNGRPLDADALVSAGIAAMLLDQRDVDFKDVANDLAAYLAGPPVDIWDYAILDASMRGRRTHPRDGRLGADCPDCRTAACLASNPCYGPLPAWPTLHI